MFVHEVWCKVEKIFEKLIADWIFLRYTNHILLLQIAYFINVNLSHDREGQIVGHLR
jgi:hypothetical protein